MDGAVRADAGLIPRKILAPVHDGDDFHTICKDLINDSIRRGDEFSQQLGVVLGDNAAGQRMFQLGHSRDDGFFKPQSAPDAKSLGPFRVVIQIRHRSR